MTFGSSIKKFFQNAYSTVKGVVSTVYKDVKGVFGYAGQQVNKLTDGASAVVKSLPAVATKAIDTAGSAVSSISNALPYVVGAAAIGLIGYTYMTGKAPVKLNWHGGKRSYDTMQNCHTSVQNCHYGNKAMKY